MSLKVRRATRADAAAICEVQRCSVRGLARSAYTSAQIEAWIGNRQPGHYAWALDHGELMFVAEEGEGVIGYGLLLGHEVRAVYVHPDAAEKGVGRALLSAIEEAARERGIGALDVHASLNAEGFYRAHGYEPEEEVDLDLPSGVKLPAIRMRKNLRPAR